MNPASDSKRLLAALTISCLMHAALVIMPYLGAGGGVSRPAARGGQQPVPARVLDATLALERGPAAAVIEKAAEGDGIEDPSAHRIAEEEPRPALESTLGIGLLPMPAPSYYTTDQLTKRPRPSSEPELGALETGPAFAPGSAILKLWISERGDVVSVEVEKTSLPEAATAAAVAIFGKLRFVPGEINGRRVGTMMRIEVIYDDGVRPPP